MKFFLTILLIVAGGNAFAQLASERPMNEVYTQPIRQKLDQPKTNASPARQLPSEAALPKQVTTAKARVPASHKTEGKEAQRKKLPSNAKKMPAVKPPKKK